MRDRLVVEMVSPPLALIQSDPTLHNAECAKKNGSYSQCSCDTACYASSLGGREEQRSCSQSVCDVNPGRRGEEEWQPSAGRRGRTEVEDLVAEIVCQSILHGSEKAKAEAPAVPGLDGGSASGTKPGQHSQVNPVALSVSLLR